MVRSNRSAECAAVLLTAVGIAALAPSPALAGSVSTGTSAGFAVQQASARNYVSVIQARNPFLTRGRHLTVTTGGTTVTEIVEIGPDPGPLSVQQAGAGNHATIYQRGTRPVLDLRQTGGVNAGSLQQHAMP